MKLDDDDLMVQRICRACDRIRPGTTFDKWLLRNYGETYESIEKICLATGSPKDVPKVMNWYRKRYEKEKRQYEAVQQLNIFDYMEVNKNGI